MWKTPGLAVRMQLPIDAAEQTAPFGRRDQPLAAAIDQRQDGQPQYICVSLWLSKTPRPEFGQPCRRPGPQRTVADAAQARDDIRRQAVFQLKALFDLTMAQAAQPLIGADPQIFGAAIGEREDRIAQQPVRGIDGQHASPAIVTGQAFSERSHPDGARLILKHRPRVVAGEPLARGNGHRPAIDELIQAVLGADPDAAFMIFADGQDRALRETLTSTKTFNLIILQPADSLFGAHPDAAIARLSQAADRIVRQTVGTSNAPVFTVSVTGVHLEEPGRGAVPHAAIRGA